MKPLNEKIRKAVRVFVFALVATASVGAALAMKPAERSANTYKYGIVDNNDGNWRVVAYLDDPTTAYNCDIQTTTCTVTYDTQEPLSPEALIPKGEAENPEPGLFSML